ncbi:MAG TPA: phospholipase D-like domain-containing protein [Thermoanaerobaculia bacterium]|nr:phospholipase D-like domain-containing protein [Thermoanaerobaculia bacterium]
MAWLVAILLVATVLFAYSAIIKARRMPVSLEVQGDVGRDGLMRAMAAYTWGRVIEGNRVTIIQNSAFFDVLIEEVGAARHHVHLETFLWRDGVVSERVAGALMAAAQRGVDVRVLVDQRGAKKTDPRVWGRLRAAGCDFRVFHRMRIGEFPWYNHRDHRKIVVIDGRLGFTFGHGIADMWGGSEESPHGWRDTAARCEGPIVAELQAAFFDNWSRTTGRVIARHDLFPPLERAGDTPLHVAYASPRGTLSAVQRLYYFAIATAREEIILQNPYFLPSRRAMELFAEAAARGVRISILLPTVDTNDFSIVQHASHVYYGDLLKLGARVYEYTRGLHLKVMIIDGQWCTIGSTNFDPRSFRINDEITLAVCDAGIAAELRRAFHDDLRLAEEWTLERWKARSMRHRIEDRWSALFKRQL